MLDGIFVDADWDAAMQEAQRRLQASDAGRGSLLTGASASNASELQRQIADRAMSAALTRPKCDYCGNHQTLGDRCDGCGANLRRTR